MPRLRGPGGAGPAAESQYSPISAATWSGTGTYEALGGTGDASSHVFTVSQTLDGVSGTPVAINLAERQRVLVDDSQSGWTVGTSFLAKTGTETDIDFTASVVDSDRLAAFQDLIDPGQVVLGAWDITAKGSGYSSTDPVYLSFAVGPGLSPSDLHLWHFAGTDWLSFSASDLTCNDGYASFTVTGLSTYAVSAVPEPSTLVLLVASAIAGLLLARRRARPNLPSSRQ